MIRGPCPPCLAERRTLSTLVDAPGGRVFAKLQQFRGFPFWNAPCLSPRQVAPPPAEGTAWTLERGGHHEQKTLHRAGIGRVPDAGHAPFGAGVRRTCPGSLLLVLAGTTGCAAPVDQEPSAYLAVAEAAGQTLHATPHICIRATLWSSDPTGETDLPAPALEALEESGWQIYRDTLPPDPSTTLVHFGAKEYATGLWWRLLPGRRRIFPVSWSRRTTDQGVVGGMAAFWVQCRGSECRVARVTDHTSLTGVSGEGEALASGPLGVCTGRVPKGKAPGRG